MQLKNYIYDLFIRAYVCLIYLAALFNPKAKAWIDGRKNQNKRLLSSFENNTALVAWFHCASLGEFEQARPLIEAFKTNFEKYKILLTFFSPSGYQIQQNYPIADWVYYLPADTQSAAKSFCDSVNPSLVFFIKYEFWYNFLTVLAKKKVPVFSVSSILRNRQWILNPNNIWGKDCLSGFTHFFVQQKQTAYLLVEQANIDQSKITISGDTRYDRVWNIAQNEDLALPQVLTFVSNTPICVAGSVWDQDMQLIIKMYNLSDKNLKLIIAPHEINADQIQKWKNSFEAKSILWSQINNFSDFEIQNANVLFIDCIGLLSRLYKYGNMAWIGGGFGSGIHNSLEAAAFGLPIGFGPKYKKFQEAKQLVDISAATACNNISDLQNWFDYQIQNPEQSRLNGQKGANMVAQNRNATDIIINKLKSDWIKF